MGDEAKHPGPPQVLFDLRETLIKAWENMSHWAECPRCDPDDWATTMLLVVGWDWTDYALAVLASG